MHTPVRPPYSLYLQTKQLDPFFEPQPGVWSPLQCWWVWHLGRGHRAQMEDSEEHIHPRAWE